MTEKEALTKLAIELLGAEAETLLAAGYVPEFWWRRRNQVCTTGEASKNLEIEAREAELRARGICPRCTCSGGHHRANCPAWAPRSR